MDFTLFPIIIPMVIHLILIYYVNYILHLYSQRDYHIPYIYIIYIILNMYSLSILMTLT